MSRLCGNFESWGTDQCSSCDSGRVTLFVANKKCISCDPAGYKPTPEIEEIRALRTQLEQVTKDLQASKEITRTMGNANADLVKERDEAKRLLDMQDGHVSELIAEKAAMTKERDNLKAEAEEARSEMLKQARFASGFYDEIGQLNTKITTLTKSLEIAKDTVEMLYSHAPNCMAPSECHCMDRHAIYKTYSAALESKPSPDAGRAHIECTSDKCPQCNPTPSNGENNVD